MSLVNLAQTCHASRVLPRSRRAVNTASVGQHLQKIATRAESRRVLAASRPSRVSKQGRDRQASKAAEECGQWDLRHRYSQAHM